MPTKRYEREMTERQYKTLRKLVLLWFKMTVRRRYKITQNLILLASLIANTVFFYVYKTGSHITIIERPIVFEEALNLETYTSISYPNQNLQKRYNNLYKRYLEDKARPNSYYYTGDGKTIDKAWKTYCRTQLKKIIFIKARIRDIEQLLETTYPDRTEKLQNIIEENKHEETLSDMSNYYARFLTAEEYNYIIKTMD